jgi:hypothetical protein
MAREALRTQPWEHDHTPTASATDVASLVNPQNLELEMWLDWTNGQFSQRRFRPERPFMSAQAGGLGQRSQNPAFGLKGRLRTIRRYGLSGLNLDEYSFPGLRKPPAWADINGLSGRNPSVYLCPQGEKGTECWQRYQFWFCFTPISPCGRGVGGEG